MSELLKPKTMTPDFIEDDQLISFIEKNIARESEIKRLKLQNSVLTEKQRQSSDELQKLKVELEKTKAESQTLATEEQRNKLLRQELEQVLAQISQMKIKVKDWEKEYSQLAFDTMSHENKIRELEAEVITYKKNAQSYDQNANIKTAEINTLKKNYEHQIQERDQLILSLRRKIKTFDDIVNSERSKISKFNEYASKLNAEMTELKKRHELELKTKDRDLNHRLNSLENDYKIKLEQSERRRLSIENSVAEKYEQEVASLKQDNAQFAKGTKSLREEVIKLKTLLEDQKSHYERVLGKSKEDFTFNLAEVKQTLERSELINGSLRAKIKEVEDRLKASNEQVQMQADKIKQLQINEIRIKQIDLESSQVQREQESIAAKENALNKKAEELSRQEHHLKQFRATLNEAKERLSKSANGLMAELQSAQHLTPMRDLLSFTKFEIERVASALRRTPTLAPERVTLEHTLKQLEEQQGFLQLAINNSEAAISEQAQAVEGLIKGGFFFKSPPSPLDLDS